MSASPNDEPARVVVADPPWQFRDPLPGDGRGAAKHYPCLSLSAIQRFPLPPLAEAALLLLWRVASLQREALAVVEVWGFVAKAELVWLKRTATSKRHFGMGRIVRNEHEVCLVATRGQFIPRSHSIRSTFEAPAGLHSAKPEAFYRLVEELADGPYVELFARRARPGWRCFGNQLAGGMAAPDEPQLLLELR